MSSTPAKSTTAASADVVAAIEAEMSWLARGLEAAQRRRAYPLDRAQYLLLLIVQAHGPQTVMELADRLLLDGSTVTRQIAVMEERGLIERHANPADGRSVLIRETALGARDAAKMRQMRLQRMQKLFKGWSDAERDAFATLLAKFNTALTASLRAEDN
ncbi:MarR family winged helix-turn-helix transcriptional regulator [Rhodopseudomonas palustris]|uniref:Transcriptional regulator, MarR family n=1 Tax=Rhodopseudomonas palustris (strain BisB18) TaxID=316056 RepID=Q210L6_RHOPB